MSGRVTVRLTGCPALPRAAGCVYTRRPRVIYLRPGLRDPRGILLHELGHVFDLLVLNNGDRARFRRVMGQPRTRRWWSGRIPRAEWFAEGYSWCARYSRIVSIERYAGYHYRPGAAQHRRVCALIERAARDRTPPVAPKAPPPVIGPDLAPAPAPSTAPGTVPGDPRHDPGPGPPESPTATPTPTATPVPTVVPVPPLPVPTPTPRA